MKLRIQIQRGVSVQENEGTYTEKVTWPDGY